LQGEGLANLQMYANGEPVRHHFTISPSPPMREET
jgi:hypothetical protein